jgi:predicted transcriptional regulator
MEGSDLARIRKSVGLTQTDVAQRWGCSQSLVARLEGAPISSVTIRSLQSYITALGGACCLRVDIGDRAVEINLSRPTTRP